MATFISRSVSVLPSLSGANIRALERLRSSMRDRPARNRTSDRALPIARLEVVPHTPRQFLDQLDEFFANERIPLEERRALWDVLTATRGPDRPRDRKRVGHRVTAILRAHAFPKTAAMLVKGAKKGFKPKMDPKGSLARAAEQLHDGGGHFHIHAWKAILALTGR